MGAPFPRLAASSINPLLKATMAALQFDQGGMYSSHAFRRDATDEVKNSGQTIATILKSGTWISAFYKNYIGINADESINSSQLLI